MYYEPIVQLVKAIKYAISEGKWGRAIGAIGLLVVGSIASFFAPLHAYTIMSTAVNMATAICYGNFTGALISLGIGIAMYAIQSLISSVEHSWNPLKSGFNTMLDNVGNAMSKVAETLGNAFEGVLNALGNVVDSMKTIGEMLYNPEGSGFWNSFGGVLRGYGGGLITAGISRHISDEINKTSNWLGKLGIGLLGATLLMPATAFANPTFDTQMLNKPTELMNELIFNSFTTAATAEACAALEDELGEEWYVDLLKSTVSTVISSGFNVLKNAVHNSLAPKHQALVIIDKETNQPVVVTEDNLQIQASEIVDNGDGTKTAIFEKLNITVTYSQGGTVQKQTFNHFNYDEMMGYEKSALFSSSGKITDWEISYEIMEEKFSYLLSDAWGNIEVTQDNTIKLSVFLDEVEAAGGGFMLVTKDGFELSGNSADSYIARYGLDGVDLYLTDSNGIKLSGPGIELYVDDILYSIDRSNMGYPNLELPISEYQSPYNPNILANWSEAINIMTQMANAVPEPWETQPGLYWNTHGGETMSFINTRLGVIGTSIISVTGDVLIVSGGMATAPTGAGVAIALFGGLNVIDDVYYFVNALGSSNSDYQNFTSYDWVFPGNGLAVKNAFSVFNLPSSLRNTFKYLKNVKYMNIRNIRNLFFNVSGNAISIKGLIDYLNNGGEDV